MSMIENTLSNEDGQKNDPKINKILAPKRLKVPLVYHEPAFFWMHVRIWFQSKDVIDFQ
jgi:hypothetical protein